MMLLADEIKSILSAGLPALKKRYPISGMAIFGSYARGEATDISDLDIIVEFDGEIGWEFFDLAKDIEELVHTRVDLVSEKAIKPHYWPHIKQDMIYV
jgi:predicted nucleotidyltransferase